MSVIKTTIDIKATMKNVGEIARQMYQIQDEISKAKSAIIEELEPIEDKYFWAMIDVINKNIKQTKNHKIGVERFIHNASFGHVDILGHETDIIDVLRFYKAYQVKTGELYNSLLLIIEGYGDDSYGDIVDSFPLFGKERYEKALKGKIEGKSEDQYQGENYIRLTMDKKTDETFARACCRNDDEEN